MTRRHRSTIISGGKAVSAPRVALYMRVSTGRQSDHDLSIPDQRSQLQSWCSRQGYTVVAEFVEPGSSATDDRRPVFQQMIERACDGERTFEVIAVHSYSRFFREAFEQEFYLRRLAKHGVRVVSITQPVGDEKSVNGVEDVQKEGASGEGQRAHGADCHERVLATLRIEGRVRVAKKLIEIECGTR